MSCGGCDDCPTSNWHLHVTAEPHFQKGPKIDTMRLLLSEEFGLDSKIVQVTNVIPYAKSYNELIPTLASAGSEAVATRKLFDLGAFLLEYNWSVKRLKIEGDFRVVPVGRVLYYEAHMKNLEPLGSQYAQRYSECYHISVNRRSEIIYTVRSPQLVTVQNLIAAVLDSTQAPKIEACVLDTAPELDSVWMGERS